MVGDSPYIEFIFVTLRSKSVGEGIKLTPTCEHCEEVNDVKINLEEIKVANLEDAPDKHIKLTDNISVDLKWHTMKDRHKELKQDTETETVINMIIASLETIYSGEDIFAVKDVPKGEVIEFVESLNNDQFNDMVEVLSNAPYLSYNS